ncbi:SgcQ protein [Candidatus Formimonas warabiya]|uniref:SgcQ protein n=2 Tax=Formimonas warabiya TaxID=1761012 RepID=A0A3G1L1Y7_FORW1|nr:SgcQ protein [Candidatus Formimonas warabiya]
MCHLQALPGDPYYDKDKGMDDVIEKARHDLHALQNGGVDAVMFSNEFSLPYLTKVRTETVAAMARIIGELRKEISVPYGVNVLWDPKASITLATVTGAKFVREIFTGVYASDFGLWNTDCGDTFRHAKAIDAHPILKLFNIVPEAAKYLAQRDIEEIVQGTIFNCRPDVLCVSGLTAGSETSIDTLRRVKKVAGATPVFANTGVRHDNIEQQLASADGAVVGTAFKIDGKFENLVDEGQVKRFMEKVKSFRN